jgi:hypothetical protein
MMSVLRRYLSLVSLSIRSKIYGLTWAVSGFLNTNPKGFFDCKNERDAPIRKFLEALHSRAIIMTPLRTNACIPRDLQKLQRFFRRAKVRPDALTPEYGLPSPDPSSLTGCIFASSIRLERYSE